VDGSRFDTAPNGCIQGASHFFGGFCFQLIFFSKTGHTCSSFNRLGIMTTVSYETCPTSAPFFGFMGVTAALCFASKFSH
jgi:hypothetical protein